MIGSDVSASDDRCIEINIDVSPLTCGNAPTTDRDPLSAPIPTAHRAPHANLYRYTESNLLPGSRFRQRSPGMPNRTDRLSLAKDHRAIGEINGDR